MLSYMLPTGNKPPPGEPSQNYNRTTKLSNRNDHHQEENSIIRNSTPRRNVVETTQPYGRMTTTTSMTMHATSPTSRIENDTGELRYHQTDTRLESPKHNGNGGINSNATTTTTTARKSTLHTSSRVTKDDSLHSIDSEASTVGSDRKSKIINGAKHASLKRYVIFISIKHFFFFINPTGKTFRKKTIDTIDICSLRTKSVSSWEIQMHLSGVFLRECVRKKSFYTNSLFLMINNNYKNFWNEISAR